MVDLYNREEFIAQWAKCLKVDPNPYNIAVQLINVNKNYDTAMSLIFGLSWANDTQYLRRVTDYFKSVWPDNGVADVNWLVAFVKHYVEDKEKYPE